MWNLQLSDSELWLYTTLVFIVRYLLFAGAGYFLCYKLFGKQLRRFKLQPKFPALGQIKEEIGFSILTFIIYGSGVWLFLYWIENGMTRKYELIATHGLPYFIVSIALMILLHDAYFYWTHRLIHHPVLFRIVHGTHHKFKTPTPWAAFAFHPFEAILSMGIIPLIIFIVPFHQLALICFISFMVLHNVIIHLGFNTDRFRLSKGQNSSTEHDYHHLKGHGNYGLYFTFWDKLMGTYCAKESYVLSQENETSLSAQPLTPTGIEAEL